MAGLAHIPEKDIKVSYYGFGHYLLLEAEGEISSIFTTPFFEKDELWFGGLRFTLNTFTMGMGPAVQKHYVAEPLKLEITLPQKHFNSKFVYVETFDGTFKVEINYVEFPGIPDPPTEQDKHTDKNVLPLFTKALVPGNKLIISTDIPTLEGFKAYVRPSFNPKYFKLHTTHYVGGLIVWTFEWNELPTGAGENPQPINILTETYNNLISVDARWHISVQPYLVYLVEVTKQE